MGLEELLRRSDVVILHVPLTPGTHHLIGADRLALMKPGGLLVNVSRGGLVDTDAVIKALDGGHLAGAAFDVLESEPHVPAALLDQPGALLTPHVAFSSDASVTELRRRAAEEVVRILMRRGTGTSLQRPRPPARRIGRPAMSAAPVPQSPDPALSRFLTAHGLAAPGEAAHWTPLAGGVSSDLWRVDLPGRSLCVKRALARLRVAADWEAPVSRNAYEWAWMRFASRHRPDSVPELLAHDPEAGLRDGVPARRALPHVEVPTPGR